MTTIPPTRHLDLATLLETPQPTIDLRLQEFEDTTRRFLKAVSHYSTRAIEEISERKTRHALELKKVGEKKQNAEAEIMECKVKEIKLMEVLDHELAERKDAESSVAELKRQFASLKEKCTSVDIEIEQYRGEVQALRSEKRKETTVLDRHASQVTPELRVIEEKLGCILEGIDREKLLIRFTRIDPSEPDREFSLVLDLSSRTYKVPVTTPPIPTLPLLVDHLNKTRDIYNFVKTIRTTFAEMVSS